WLPTGVDPRRHPIDRDVGSLRSQGLPEARPVERAHGVDVPRVHGERADLPFVEEPVERRPGGVVPRPVELDVHDVDEWTGELVTAFHAPEAWRHPLPLADARRVAVRTAPERLRARGGLGPLDDRDAEQSFLVPQGDRVTDAEVAVVRDVTVPGVVRIVLVVVPGVATVPTVVARCHEEPGALWKLPRHVPSLARAQDEENQGV